MNFLNQNQTQRPSYDEIYDFIANFQDYSQGTEHYNFEMSFNYVSGMRFPPLRFNSKTFFDDNVLDVRPFTVWLANQLFSLPYNKRKVISFDDLFIHFIKTNTEKVKAAVDLEEMEVAYKLFVKDTVKHSHFHWYHTNVDNMFFFLTTNNHHYEAMNLSSCSEQLKEIRYEFITKLIPFVFSNEEFPIFEEFFIGEYSNCFIFQRRPKFNTVENHFNSLMPSNEARGIKRVVMDPQSTDSTNMTTGEEGSSVDTKTSVNVELVDNRGTKTASPMDAVQVDLILDPFSIPPSTYPDLTDRFNNIGSFNWSVSDESQKIIDTLNVPYDIVKILSTNPSTLPLQQFEYFRPNLTIQYQLNSTQFHTGLLCIGAMYYAQSDGLTPGVRSPSSTQKLWSLDFATLRAGSSNVVEMKIPYQSFMDRIPIRYGVQGSSNYYCTVYVGVASPLNIKEGSETVTVTRQVQFSCDGVQTQFYGQITRRPVFEPQGIFDTISNVGSAVSQIGAAGSKFKSSLISGAESLLGGFGAKHKSTSEDKPMLPLEAVPFVQFPSVSMSWGVGPTPGHSLRLDPSQLTPHHPDTVPLSGDTLGTFIPNKWGYVTSFQLSVTDPVNTLIGSVPISPLLYSKYGDLFLPTPMSGYASMFSYWSGQITLKFIVVKANPQSLRIRFSSIPGPLVTGEQLVDYPSTIQDFQEITDFEYTPPYFGSTKMVPTLYQGSFVNLGNVQLRLENVFSSISVCADVIDIIVLAKANENLNLAVPRPVLWRPSGTTLSAGMASIFLDYSRYGKPTGDLTYEVYRRKLGAGNSWINTDDSNPEVIEVGYGYYYCVTPRFLVPTQVGGDSAEFHIVTKLDSAAFPDFEIWRQRKGPGVMTSYEVKYNEITYTFSVYPILERQDFEFELENTILNRIVMQPQNGEERTEDVTNSSGPLTHNIMTPSVSLLGESFSLVDSLKRYQIIHTDRTVFDSDGEYRFAFDLNYGSIHARAPGELVSNLTFCHDAFRFGKGSLNFNVIVDFCSASNIKLRIFHIPAGFSSDFIVSPQWLYSNEDPYAEGIFAHEVIATTNTSMPINVPYYNPANYLVNGYDPGLSGYCTNLAYAFGRVVIYVNTVKNTTLHMSIHRSLGDDADLYTFQGWPAAVNNPGFTDFVGSMPFTPSQRVLMESQSEDVVEEVVKSSEEEEGTQEDAKNVFDTKNMLNIFLQLKKNAQTRREKVLLKKYLKYFDRISFESQDDDLTPIQLDQVVKYIESLTDSYLGMSACQVVAPQPVLSVITEEEIYLISNDPVDGENYQWKECIEDIIYKLDGIYPHLSHRFYSRTKLEKPPPGRISHLVQKMFRRCCSSVNSNIFSAIQNKWDEFDRSLGQAPSTVLSILSSIIKFLAKGALNALNVYLIFTNLKILVSAPQPWLKATAFTTLLAIFGFLSSKGMLISAALCSIMSSFAPSTVGYIYMSPQDSDVKEDVVRFLSFLMAGVAALAGFRSAKSWDAGVEAFIKNLSVVGNSWHTLLSKSCSFMVDYLIWLFGIQNPGTLASQELSARGIDVKDWAVRVMELTNPANHDLVVASPLKRSEVSKLYEEGSIIVKLVNSVENRGEIAQVATFLSLWRKLVELYQETGEAPDSIKANMTPICLWIEGPPGVGKSQAAKKIAVDLAALLEITYDGDPCFVRTPRKYWDGYNGQPIIIFDDALQMTDPELRSKFLEDWYGLLTNAPYSPEFSNISEKKKFVTPRLIICLSNQAYPRPTGVANLESFLRRRDVVIHCDLKQELRDRGIVNADDLRLAPTELEGFNHLTFSQRNDVFQDTGFTGSWSLNDLIKKLHPMIQRKETQRRILAEKHIELSCALKPEQIEETRKLLLEQLSMTQSVSSLATEIVSEAVNVLTPQDDPHCNLVPYVFHQNESSPDNLDFCLEDCCSELNRVACFCCVTDDVLHNAFYCSSCGTFYLKKSKGNVILALPDECDHPDKLRNHDRVVKVAQEKFLKVPGGDILKFPKNRVPSLFKRSIRKVDLSRFAAWFKRLSGPLWSLLPLKFLIPIGLCLSLFYILKFTTTLEKLKNLFSVGADDSQNYLPKKALSDRAPAWAANLGRRIEEPEEEKAPGWIFNPSVGAYERPLQVSAQVASSGSVGTKVIAKGRMNIHKAQDDAQEQLVRRVYRNRVQICVFYENGTCSKTFGLGLCERNILFPRHVFIKQSCPVVSVDLRLPGVSGEGGLVTLFASDFEFTQIRDSDSVVFKVLNRRIPQFRNITNAFVSESKLSSVSRRGILLNVLGDDFEIPKVSVLPIEPAIVRATYLINGKTEDFDLCGYSYPLQGAGMCGSVLIDREHGTIIGMHTSGYQSRGYSFATVQEDFEGLKPKIDVIEPSLKVGGSVTPDGEFIPIGLVPQDQSVALPLSSQITKSSCFGVLRPPARAPVQMIEPGEAVPGLTNLTLAVGKGGKPSLPWSLEDIDRAVSDLEDQILTHCPPITNHVEVRTLNEAIVGVPGVPFMDPLKRDTSVGWPLCVSGKGTKKKHYVQYEETNEGLSVVGLHTELSQLYGANHDLRKRGIIPFSPYMNFLKDERLKPGKRPRLINGCPMDQTIEFRRYVLDFCAAVQSAGLNKDIGIAIGINVHGPQWSNLANDLLSMGDRIICGDYSGFGPGLDPELVLRCGEIVNKWYAEYQNVNCENREEDDLVRTTLFENLAFSHELSRDTVLQTLCGSPSGNPFTALINSLVNLLYIRLAWLEWFRGTVLEDFNQMRKHLCVFVYGDDLIASVSPYISDSFDNSVLQEILGSKNIVYTDADKSGNIRKTTDIADATFLKCHFIKHPTRGNGFWLAALEKPMIEDIPNWIRKPFNDIDEVSLANSIECGRLSYAWGVEYYNSIKSALTQYWRGKGKSYPLESWDYLDALYFGELRGVTLPKSIDPSSYEWA